MDTIEQITEEVMRQMEMIKELQAEVKALKGEIARRPISFEQRLLEWSQNHE